jgi:AcrR family transcriptional regulator
VRSPAFVGGPGGPGPAGPTPAILLATLQVIAEEGFAGFSVDKVAAAAGVGKATIYRRWPSKEDLIHDAVAQIVTNLPDPDTGSLRGDLLAFNRQLLEQADSLPAMSRVIPALVAESTWDPQLQSVLDQLLAARADCGYVVIRRAKARGELAQDVPDGLIIDLSSGWFFWRMALVKERPTDDELERMVDGLLHGFLQGPPVA